MVCLFQVQNAGFCISKTAEFTVLKEKMNNLEKETYILQEKVNVLKTNHDEIKASMDNQIKQFGNVLKVEKAEREQRLCELEGKIRDKEKQIEEVKKHFYHVVYLDLKHSAYQS